MSSFSSLPVQSPADSSPESSPADSSPESSPAGYVCDFCAKPFFTRCNLVRHRNSVHIRKEEFPCDACTRVFYDINNLRKHAQRVHHPDALTCQLCCEEFPDKNTLRNHTRQMHRGKGMYAPPKSKQKRKFPCMYCGKNLFSAASCRRHEAIHREKEFECKRCGRLFAQESNLLRHQGAYPKKPSSSITRQPLRNCRPRETAKKRERSTPAPETPTKETEVFLPLLEIPSEEEAWQLIPQYTWTSYEKEISLFDSGLLCTEPPIEFQ